MATYNASSPYFTTGVFGNYLDIMNKRAITANKDDIIYRIQEVYQNRPDLLAYDLYKDAGLWWVFAVRNPNRIKDPIWDFRAGVRIYLPKLSSINDSLGL